MAQAVQAPDNAGQLLTLSKVLQGLMSERTTATSTVAPGVLEALMGITNEYSKSSAVTDANAMFAAALQKAAMEFAPILGQERAAGAYKSSGVRQLGEQAQVAAAGEAARAVLQAVAQYGGIASNAAGNAASATRSQTTSTSRRPDPGSILTQAGTIAALQLLRGKKPKTGAAATAAKTGVNAGLNKGISALFGTSEAAAAGLAGGVDIFGPATAVTGLYDPTALGLSQVFGGGSVDLAGLADALPSIVSNVPYDFLTSPVGDLAAESLGGIVGDFASSAGIDFATSAASSAVAEGLVGDPFIDAFVGDSLGAAADIGIGIPYVTLARLGADALGIKEVGQVLDGVTEGVTSFVEDVGGGIVDAVGGIFDAIGRISVICTWLYVRGLMSKQLYVMSSQAFKEYQTRGLPVEGYYFWAFPYIRLMGRSPLAVHVAKYLMAKRAQYIGWSRGHKMRFTLIGSIAAGSMFAVSYVCGKLLQHRKLKVA